jgi:hypothetical protein
MSYKKEYLCDSCYYAEIKIIDIYIPIYATSSRCNKTQHLSIWCNYNYHYIGKMISVKDRKKCGYRPKAGKINKYLTQKQLI